VPSYVNWLQACDMRPAYEYHRLVLQVLQRTRKAKRWVLKSPVHLHSLPTLLDVYPDARVAFTHRDPHGDPVRQAARTVYSPQRPGR
jgi:hypothetical protein